MGTSALIHLDRVITNFGRSSDALEGSPAPSTIQGSSDDPLFWTVFATEVIISCNIPCKELNVKMGEEITYRFRT